MVCSDQENWVSVRNRALRASELTRRKHGLVKCEMRLLESLTGFEVVTSTRIEAIADGFPLVTDFFQSNSLAANKN